MDPRIKKILKNPKMLFFTLGHREFLNFINDKRYIEIGYKIKFGKKPDLDNPKTFNEKLQWLKLYDRNPIYTTLVDKYSVKEYVSNIIGEKYIIPTLGVWDSFDDIDFDKLPNQFVLKCTHDSGGLIICKNKQNLDIKKAEKKIKACLKHNFFWGQREWPYKNVKPRIIAEEFMKDRDYDTLNVFKIFNFNGEPKIIQTIQNDKTPNETIDYFDTNWNILELRQNFPNSDTPIERPDKLDEMLSLARILAKDTSPFIRTDFYEINGEVYFSEFTFYSDSGLAKFTPDEWDIKLGDMIQLQ